MQNCGSEARRPMGGEGCLEEAGQGGSSRVKQNWEQQDLVSWLAHSFLTEWEPRSQPHCPFNWCCHSNLHSLPGFWGLCQD